MSAPCFPVPPAPLLPTTTTYSPMLGWTPAVPAPPFPGLLAQQREELARLEVMRQRFLEVAAGALRGFGVPPGSPLPPASPAVGSPMQGALSQPGGLSPSRHLYTPVASPPPRPPSRPHSRPPSLPPPPLQPLTTAPLE
eukprot:RCo034731